MTRSQSSRKIRTEQAEMETFSNNESNASYPDFYSGDHFTEINVEAIRTHERDHERIRIEQRFMDMNRQIAESTSMVKAFSENMSRKEEENGQNGRMMGRPNVLTPISLKTQVFDLCESVQICRIFAGLCRYVQMCRIFANVCRYVLTRIKMTHSETQ